MFSAAMYAMHMSMRRAPTIIRDVAIIMMLLILATPAIVHAYTLEMLRAETTLAVGGDCHDTNDAGDHDSTGNHQSDVRCCGLDAPYILSSFHNPMIPDETGILDCPCNGRHLAGYVVRIYKPPR